MTEYTKQQMYDNRLKWIAALRSGKYTQGKYKLRSKDNLFCCLGVACEVLKIKSQLLKGFLYIYEGEQNSGFLPKEAINMLGLYYADGTLIEGEIALSAMNDTQQLSFLEIADYLEQNLDKGSESYMKE